MTVESQPFFSRCPHCRTIFRVGSVVSDRDEAWVKCGHCKKIFDYRINRVDLADYAPDPKVASAEEVKGAAALSGSEPDGSAIRSGGGSDTSSAQSGLFSEQPIAEAKKSSRSSESIKKTDLPATQQTGMPDPLQNTLPAAEQLTIFRNRKADTVSERQQQQCPGTATSSPQAVKQKRHQRTNNVKIDVSNPLKEPVEQTSPQKDSLAKTPELKKSGSVSLGSPQQETMVANQSEAVMLTDAARRSKKPISRAYFALLSLGLNRGARRTGKKINFIAWLMALALFALLIWQSAIVHYTKLAQYDVLKAPMSVVCAMVSCNQQTPRPQAKFEILHANLRRHASYPGVMTISANLINYSNKDRSLPSVRLDLTNQDDVIIASKTINLVDNPQYMDPPTLTLAPGQDVKIKFNIDHPPSAAIGFNLNIFE